MRSVVTEANVLKLDRAINVLQRYRPPRILILGTLTHNFLGSFQSGQCFGDLRANRNHLQNRRDEEHKVQVVGDVPAGRQGVTNHLLATDVHGRGPNKSQ